jgi:hypothetical protein
VHTRRRSRRNSEPPSGVDPSDNKGPAEGGPSSSGLRPGCSQNRLFKSIPDSPSRKIPLHTRRTVEPGYRSAMTGGSRPHATSAG